jgi:hypothetical protein
MRDRIRIIEAFTPVDLQKRFAKWVDERIITKPQYTPYDTIQYYPVVIGAGITYTILLTYQDDKRDLPQGTAVE